MSNRSHRKRRRIVAGGLTLLLALGPSAQAFAESAAEQRLRVLEETLKKTQEEVHELHRRLDQQKAASQETQKKVDEAATSARTASADAKKAVSLPDWLSRTTVFGDVRYRHEGFYNQPHAQKAVVTARNRERIRARLGVRFAYSDELSATIRGASGNPNDPISTNETLTSDFTRKNFNLDWAYLTFAPGQSFGIRPGAAAFSAGKFPLPMFRVGELVFDEDVSPEGLSQTFQLLGQPLGPLDQVKLHGLEWTFAEIANQQDGWMFGGQVNPSLHFGGVQLEAGLAQYWWLNPDLIAQALSRNTTAFTASGAAVANSSFNSSLVNTNLLVTKSIQPPTTTPGRKPAAFTAITGYKSGFNQSNFTLAATVPNVVLAQPLGRGDRRRPRLDQRAPTRPDQDQGRLVSLRLLRAPGAGGRHLGLHVQRLRHGRNERGRPRPRDRLPAPEPAHGQRKGLLHELHQPAGQQHQPDAHALPARCAGEVLALNPHNSRGQPERPGLADGDFGCFEYRRE
ncbi:MAG: hypothetical protein E6J60_05530 [Deltaproteobacteria bacterium]|nr:MAG: hypothetical protein E6J60_05530 [Deltaproteobacteria bacterium]